MKKEENSLIDILRFLYFKRKFILFFTLGVGLLTAIVSLFMPNYYMSTTTFYAGSQSLSNPESIFGNSSSDMFFYGTDSDVDRLLSLGKSRELAEYIINKYDLSQHYDIDTTDLKGQEKLYLKFNKHLEILKNKFDAVELSFEDTDRNLVASIVNDCRTKINEISKAVIRTNQNRMIDVCQNNIEINQERLATIQDSITSISRTYNIIDPISQGEQVSTMLVNTEANIVDLAARYDYFKKKKGRSMRDSATMVASKLAGLRVKEAKLKNESLALFSQGSGKLIALKSIQTQLARRIGYDIDRLQQLNSAFNSDISVIITIEEGRTPFIKIRPKRSILVLSAILAGFFFSVIYLIMRKNLKYLKVITD